MLYYKCLYIDYKRRIYGIKRFKGFTEKGVLRKAEKFFKQEGIEYDPDMIPICRTNKKGEIL